MDWLAVILGTLQSMIVVESLGWITQPKDLHLCTGQTASFRWVYDDNRQNASFISLAKVGKPPVSLLVREGLGPAKPANSRVSFRPNAGMTLKQVTAQDQGAYRCTVNFANENNSKNVTLEDETVLNVYSRCPTTQKYFNPLVYNRDDGGEYKKVSDKLQVNSSMPARVLLLITVPAAVPPVSLRVYKEKGGLLDYTCYGTRTKDFNCTAGLYFTRDGRFQVYLSLDYPAFPEADRTIDLSIRVVGGFNSSLIVAIAIPILVLVFLVTIIFCQRKYGTEGFWQRCCDFCLGPESENNNNSRGAFQSHNSSYS